MELYDLDTLIHGCDKCHDMVEKFTCSTSVSIGKSSDILLLGEAPANN